MPSIYDNIYSKTGLDVSGIDPLFQDIRKQQQFQNQQIGQMSSLGNQGSQPASFGGINPLAMASMLRNQNPYAANQGNPYLNADTAMNLYGAGNVYGYGGQGAIPTGWTGEP